MPDLRAAGLDALQGSWEQVGLLLDGIAEIPDGFGKHTGDDVVLLAGRSIPTGDKFVFGAADAGAPLPISLRGEPGLAMRSFVRRTY